MYRNRLRAWSPLPWFKNSTWKISQKPHKYPSWKPRAPDQELVPSTMLAITRAHKDALKCKQFASHKFPWDGFPQPLSMAEEYLDSTTIFQTVVGVQNERHSATSLVFSIYVWALSSFPRNAILKSPCSSKQEVRRPHVIMQMVALYPSLLRYITIIMSNQSYIYFFIGHWLLFSGSLGPTPSLFVYFSLSAQLRNYQDSLKSNWIRL